MGGLGWIRSQAAVRRSRLRRANRPRPDPRRGKRQSSPEPESRYMPAPWPRTAGTRRSGRPTVYYPHGV